MAEWKFKIDIKTPMCQCEAGEIGYKELAREILRQLRNLPLDPEDVQIQNVIDDLEAVEDSDDQSFINDILDHLYDWGDQIVGRGQRQCWMGL